jgi:hypothetical protein
LSEHHVISLLVILNSVSVDDLPSPLGLKLNILLLTFLVLLLKLNV